MRSLIFLICALAVCSCSADELFFTQNFNSFTDGDTGLFTDGSRAVDSGEGSAEIYSDFAIGNQRTALRLTGKASAFADTTANYFIPGQTTTGQLESFTANFDSMIFSSNSSSGDFFAFNFGGITNTTSAYTGASGGMQSTGNADDVLSVVWDIKDEEIQVWYDGLQVGGSIGAPNIETSNSSQLFTDTVVSWTRTGGLNVTYGGSALVNSLDLGAFDPDSNDLFAFSAQNGTTDRTSTYLDNINIWTTVPEPSSFISFGALMLGSLLSTRRKRRG